MMHRRPYRIGLDLLRDNGRLRPVVPTRGRPYVWQLVAVACVLGSFFLPFRAGPGGEARGVAVASAPETVILASSKIGDVDCSGFVNAVDALKLLRYTIALTVTQTEPCDDLGTGGPPLQGDVDCDADVDLVDSLRVLRHVAGLSVFQNEPCPDIGT